MKSALKEAVKAYQLGEVPVGAVIVYNNKIIARGHNTRELSQSVLGHAEINAIKKASKKIGSRPLDNVQRRLFRYARILQRKLQKYELFQGKLFSVSYYYVISFNFYHKISQRY